MLEKIIEAYVKYMLKLYKEFGFTLSAFPSSEQDVKSGVIQAQLQKSVAQEDNLNNDIDIKRPNKDALTNADLVKLSKSEKDISFLLYTTAIAEIDEDAPQPPLNKVILTTNGNNNLELSAYNMIIPIEFKIITNNYILLKNIEVMNLDLFHDSNNLLLNARMDFKIKQSNNTYTDDYFVIENSTKHPILSVTDGISDLSKVDDVGNLYSVDFSATIKSLVLSAYHKASKLYSFEDIRLHIVDDSNNKIRSSKLLLTNRSLGFQPIT